MQYFFKSTFQENKKFFCVLLFPSLIPLPSMGWCLCFFFAVEDIICPWFCCYSGTTGATQEGSITRGTPTSKISVESIPSLRGSITQVSYDHSWNAENTGGKVSRALAVQLYSFVIKLFIVLGIGTGFQWW